MSVAPKPDFRLFFESSPSAYLVLTSDFTIVAVSNVYLAATMTQRDDIVGRGLFDVFPDNPNDSTADGVANLSASLHKVLRTKKPHSMAVQKYDIPVPKTQGGGFEARYWRPINTPILNSDDKVIYITHWVEDVTHMVDTLHAAMDKQKAMSEKKDS